MTRPLKAKKFFSAILAALTIMSTLTTGASAASPTFTDVPATHWAYESIEEAAASGVVNGIGNNLYGPDNTVTFVQFATMVARHFAPDLVASCLETQAANSGDAPYSYWWWPYVEALGTDDRDSLDGTKPYDNYTASGSAADDRTYDLSLMEAGITRYDMAAIMYNIITEDASSANTTVSAAVKNEIADWSSVPGEYQLPVAKCYEAELLNGVDAAGTFNGNGIMSRAQAATVMCRLIAYTDGGSDPVTGGSNSGSDSEAVDTGSAGSGGNGSGAASGAATFAKAGEGTLETPSMSISDVKDVVEHDVQKGPVYGVSDPGLLAVGAPMGAMGEVEQCRYIEAAPGIIGTFTTYYAHITAGSNSYYRTTDIRVDLAIGESITVDCRDFGHDPSDGYWDIRLCENAVDHGDGRVTITRAGDYDTAFFSIYDAKNECTAFRVYTNGITPFDYYA